MANNISKTTRDEVDSAYQVLKTAGRPLYYRELIDQAMAARGMTARTPAHVIADIHTRINLDSRFVHAGKSMWGLTEWSPQRISVREAEETAGVRQSNERREKLLAAIQQDFDTEDTALVDSDPLLEEDEAGLDEEDEELEA